MASSLAPLPSGRTSMVDLSDDHIDPLRLTVEQVGGMVSAGILPEDSSLELIDGVLCRRIVGSPEDPFVMNPPHARVLSKLNRLVPQFDAHGCIMRNQLPIVLGDATMLFPDFTIVEGEDDDYAERHPTGRDALAAIEISDGSLSRDRRTKLARYAAAGISCYVIVNLPKRVVELYEVPVVSEGRYETSATLRSGDALRLPTATDAVVECSISDLFPTK